MAIDRADVYKGGVLAAHLERTQAGVQFAYRADHLASDGRAIASTLPLGGEPIVTPAGAVPPYFAGLLPEGRRLTALRRTVKTSADDELSLLVAVGADTIGDVQVVPSGSGPPGEEAGIELDERAGFRYDDVLRATGVLERPTLAGVQDKASLAMLSLPVRRRGERYILKLDPPEYPHLVANESFFIRSARAARLPVVDARILADDDGRTGLLVTRFDRIGEGESARSVTVEDAAQASGVWPADKYNLGFEAAAAALAKLTRAPVVAALRLLEQLAFAWLTGNGDQHAKNLSVFEAVPGEFRVTPAYDLPSTVFYGDETLALSLGGSDVLTAARFVDAADVLGVPAPAARRILIDALRATDAIPDRIAAGELPFDARTNAKAARTLRRRHAELTSALNRR